MDQFFAKKILPFGVAVILVFLAVAGANSLASLHPNLPFVLGLIAVSATLYGLYNWTN